MTHHAKFKRSTLIVSIKTQTLNCFVKPQNVWIISLEYVLKLKTKTKTKKQWNIYDLLDALNNPTKFQINQIRT